VRLSTNCRAIDFNSADATNARFTRRTLAVLTGCFFLEVFFLELAEAAVLFFALLVRAEACAHTAASGAMSPSIRTAERNVFRIAFFSVSRTAIPHRTCEDTGLILVS
jgi:hypothetical protein